MAQRLKELENAVCNVIQIMKQIPELERLKLAVVGGLALWHYLADRQTDNINFITGVSTPPSLIKKKLLGHPKSPFREEKQSFLYRSPAGWDIPIEFSSQWRFPYLPRAARFVRELLYGEVPYISLADLIVFKLDSSWLTPSHVPKKSRDGDDAAALVENEMAQRAENPERAEPARTLLCPATTKIAEPVVRLSPRQENFVRDAFCDMAQCGSRDKSWWEDCLGLSRPGTGRSYVSSEPDLSSGHYGTQGWASDELDSNWDDRDGYERLDGRVRVSFRKRVNSMPQGPSWSPWNGGSTGNNTPTPGQSTPAPAFQTVTWPGVPLNHYPGDASMRSSVSLSPRSSIPREDYFGPYAGLSTLPREEDYFGPYASLATLPREDYFGPHAGFVTPTTSMDTRARTRYSRSDSGYGSTNDSVNCYCHPSVRYSSFSEGMPEMKVHFGAKLREKLLGTVAEVTTTDEQDEDGCEELMRDSVEEPAPVRKAVAFLA